jgi:hypothetical protein
MPITPALSFIGRGRAFWRLSVRVTGMNQGYYRFPGRIREFYSA